MSAKLKLELAKESFAPGEPLNGHVTVNGGDGIRALTVWLAQIESSGRYAATARREGQRTLADGPVAEGQRIPFELVVPADAAPEIQGPHGSLAWEVVVKADVRGPDAVEGARISVARAPGPPLA